MDTIFMNSENSKTSEHNVLVLKLTDKLDLRRGQKAVALSNLTIYYAWVGRLFKIKLRDDQQRLTRALVLLVPLLARGSKSTSLSAGIHM